MSGHRLSKCHSRNRCKVENCDRRHHTLLHEVDLKLIERARVKHELQTLPDGERNQAAASREGESTPSVNQALEPREQCRQSAYTGHDIGGRALIEVLPVVIFGETEQRQVMALRDSGCNTTPMEEKLAQALDLKGKEIDLDS